MKARGWAVLVLAAAVLMGCRAQAAFVWVEGEKPTRSRVTRHPWWYDQVKKDQLSGGDFISHWSDTTPGEVAYDFDAPAAGAYELWLRANPVQSKLSMKLNEAAWQPVNLAGGTGQVNLAADDKPDLRFVAWIHVGPQTLKAGQNTLAFRFESENHFHGMLDCFVLTNQPFQPMGLAKPDQVGKAMADLAAANQGWFAWAPKDDPFTADAGFDLRSLNEKTAGDGGFIGTKGSQFVHSATGEPVRFWAVNGPSGNLPDRAAMRRNARLLAKHGVNLIRIHGGYYDNNGRFDARRVQHTIDLVESYKAEGIYSHLSIYVPLWLQPKADNAFLKGYNGTQNPFAALEFNPDFQKVYRDWWTAVLTTPSAVTGRKLIDEPAVAGVEIQNEDSFFFWTFGDKNIPDPQMQILERLFGDWLKQRYGSIDAAMARWNGLKLPRDDAAAGRVAFRPLWNVFSDRTPRDRDTARFLAEQQRAFYTQTRDFLRQLGVKGLITCSNWTTASPQYLGPIEKWTYDVGDFIDRHGYFGCNQEGDNAAWSIRDGHTYFDRSALRFEGEQPGKPRVFVHPSMDPSYNNKPSMISETTWNRPNRYRTEGPLFLAAYGALQDSDCIVHFALDSADWSVKPGFFMQPWTLMSPTMMGQFPATALLYRKGLVAPGGVLVDLNLKVDDILDLKGTPLPQDAAFDELRLKDVPAGTQLQPGNVIDPLVHFAGRTNVDLTATGGAPKLADVSKLIDRAHSTVTSSHGQLRLDYGKGVLLVDAPQAQGAEGNLAAAGPIELTNVAIRSDLDVSAVLVVSLDDQPLATSGRMLVQVMSEEKATDFRTEDAGGGRKRIASIGHDPWLVKELRGSLGLKRPDAAQLKVTALDGNGYPTGAAGSGKAFVLQPGTVYYLVTR